MEPLPDADLVLALGTRLGEFTTKGYSWPRPGQKLLHVGLSAEDSGGTWAGADVALGADTGATLTALINGLGDGGPSASAIERRQAVALWRERFVLRTTPRADRAGGDDDVDPEGILFDLCRRLGDDASITCDAGNFGGWLMRYYRWVQPRTFLARPPAAWVIPCRPPSAPSWPGRARRHWPFAEMAGSP